MGERADGRARRAGPGKRDYLVFCTLSESWGACGASNLCFAKELTLLDPPPCVSPKMKRHHAVTAIQHDDWP